ncbi:MAG: DnaJ C-terminal domain-containing protein [Neorhizobium sp.]|nr:DnaJ C-terminal domain-containing protein [Neorhizobium sp.]
MRDPYSILGVKRGADATEIKAAWRSKAKSVHPDHNQGDPNASNLFAEMGEAYELLKDPERRKRYDRASDMHQTIMQQREAAVRAKQARANAEKVMEELARAKAQQAQAQAHSQAGSQPNSQANSQAQPQGHSQNQAQGQQGKAKSGSAGARGSESPEDMVERIFGVSPEAGASGDGGKPSADQADASGGRTTGSVPGSTGSATSSANTAHGYQDGAAEKAEAPAESVPLPVMAVDLITALVRRIRGTHPVPEKAPDLSVEASVTIEDLIQRRSVSVNLPEEREIRVTPERGMTDGHVMRLKGQGLKLPGMKQGDILVTLRAAKDTRFRIEGYDIHTILPITLEDAVLGADSEVETPDGKRTLTVAPWSGSDQVIRLEGLGLPDDNGTRGDLVAEIRIVLWDKPDPKVTDLMRHMRHGLYL